MNKTFYTSIEQSKKLLELGLNHESADMTYPWYIEDDGDKFEDGHQITTPVIGKSTWRGYIPCWSLAALLDVLPIYIGDYSKCLYYDNGSWCCGYMYDGDFMLTIEETKADNPVDACYKMIIKLKEKGFEL